MYNNGSSHLRSVGCVCYEGLDCHGGAHCLPLGLLQQAQLVCDVGHLLLEALGLDADLGDFLGSGRRQERLFEVHQVKGPLLLQAHQSPELIELAVHVGLQLLCRHLQCAGDREGEAVSEGMNWAKLSRERARVT